MTGSEPLNKNVLWELPPVSQRASREDKLDKLTDGLRRVFGARALPIAKAQRTAAVDDARCAWDRIVKSLEREG